MKMYNFYDSTQGVRGIEWEVWSGDFVYIKCIMFQRIGYNESVGVELGNKIELLEVDSDFLELMSTLKNKELLYDSARVIEKRQTVNLDDFGGKCIKYALTEVITDI